jgi:hypothetical protein
VENQIDNSFEKSFDKLEDRIENEHRAVSQNRNEQTESLPQASQPTDSRCGEDASRMVDVALSPAPPLRICPRISNAPFADWVRMLSRRKSNLN